MPVTGDTQTDHGGIPQNSVIVPGNPTPVLMRGSTNVSTDNNDNTTTPASFNLEQIGAAVFTLGQKIKDGSISVAIASDQIVNVEDIEQAGYIAATSPPSTTNASSDTPYTFSSQVNRVIIQNNTSANVNYFFDTVASLGSFVLVPGATLIYPKKVTVLHLYTVAAQNINGSSAGNIVVLGAL